MFGWVEDLAWWDETAEAVKKHVKMAFKQRQKN